MFPQRHSIISGSGLEQMLQLPSVPMPLPTSMDRSSSSRWKPNIEVAPNCPRCSSTNTKFCYYNNYSLSQPRYFCKGCRRYWTKGGSLRNVPVGGGCRKNRRGKSTRQQQSERLSMNNGNSGGCNDRESSSVGDGDRPGDTNNGSSDIDMALVFAKFLNQNPSSGEEFESEANNGSPFSNNLSTSLTPESVEAENDAVMQPQEPSDSIDADVLLMGGVPLEETIENFVGEEMSLSGIDELEGFLGMGADDDMVQNVLWSDATMSSSVTSWQPPMMQMQLQELEYSMMPLNEDDGQLLPIGSTMNLISDSWSTWSNSFDLSMLEVFSSSIPLSIRSYFPDN